MRDELPQRWRIKTLDDVAYWGSGGTPKRTEPTFYGGDIPWAIIGDLTDGPVSSTSTCITEAGLASSSAKWVDEGSILLAMYGSIGKLGIAAIPLTTNQAIAFAKPKESMTGRYLFWYLRSARNELRRHGKGGTQQNISQTVIKSFSIPVAPVEEQQVIVQEIEKQSTRVDAAMALLHRVKANLNRNRASLLQAASTGRLPTENDQGSSLQAPNEQTESEASALLDDLPPEWDTLSLREAGEVVTGSTPSKSNQSFYGGDVPFFKPTDLNAGYQVADARDTLTESGASAARLLPERAVLVTCIGATIGKTGFSRVRGATNQQINALITDEESVLPEWAYWVLSGPLGQRQIQESSSSTTLPILNKSRFEKILLPVPHLSVQVALVEEIEKNMSLIDALEMIVVANLRRGESLRQAILHRAFSGELVGADRGMATSVGMESSSP